jgi:hypothetical protein
MTNIRNEAQRTLCNATMLFSGSAQSYDKGAVMHLSMANYGSALSTISVES